MLSRRSLIDILVGIVFVGIAFALIWNRPKGVTDIKLFECTEHVVHHNADLHKRFTITRECGGASPETTSVTPWEPQQ